MAIPLASSRENEAWSETDGDSEEGAYFDNTDTLDKLIPFLEAMGREWSSIATRHHAIDAYYKTQVEKVLSSRVTHYVTTLLVTWLSILCVLSIVAMCKTIL